MQITTNSALTAPNNGAGTGAAAITSDFNTFLRMLTAQITNQDPLNPINSEEFAVQLATFSGVEQQVRTNELLVALAGQMGQSGFSQMAGWVGMEARAAMPVAYDGTAVSILPPNPIAGERHQLVVFDSTGAEVDRQTITASGDAVTWDGTDPSGRPLAPGQYDFWLESFSNDSLVASEPAQTYGAVREVRIDPRGMVLVMPGGIEIFADTVTALRAPGAVDATSLASAA